jgi:hypothetical protein
MQATDEWVEQPELSVAGKLGGWWIWLPANYDPARAYPVVFAFPWLLQLRQHCANAEQTGDDAILVRGTGISDNVCWDAGREGDDLPFFDRCWRKCPPRPVPTLAGIRHRYSSGSGLLIINAGVSKPSSRATQPPPPHAGSGEPWSGSAETALLKTER